MDSNTWEELRQLVAADSGLLSRCLRVARGGLPLGTKLDHPEAVVRAVQPLLLGRSHEALCVLALDSGLRLIASEIMSQGSDRYTVVDPKAILAWALRQGEHGAAALVLAHNHPSGRVEPSKQDRDVTERVSRGAAACGMTLQDHVIVTDNGDWYSFRGDCPSLFT